MKASRAILTITAATLLAAVTGCMSVEHLIDPDQKLEMYGGTTKSWEYMMSDDSLFLGSLIHLLDLPLTVALDTILLPISAPVELSRG